MLDQDFIDALQSQFALDLRGIHGTSHWARVRRNGLRLAEQTGADRSVVIYFALLHDSQRWNDGHDPDHGRRAAEYARSIREQWIPLDDHRFELLCVACRAHSAGHTEADVTVQTCWDADRLDLGRVGIRPDPLYLCTDAAKDPEVIRWALGRSREEEWI